MSVRIGIRREDKGGWERRVPIILEHVRQLTNAHGIEVWMQPSDIRVFHDDEYAEAGARLTEDLSPCPVVFGVKEMPTHIFQPGCSFL